MSIQRIDVMISMVYTNVMKNTQSLPKRKYCSGDKKMVSLRLPEELVKKLELIAKDCGWTVTDVVMTSLDDYVQHYEAGNNTKLK